MRFRASGKSIRRNSGRLPINCVIDSDCSDGSTRSSGTGSVFGSETNDRILSGSSWSLMTRQTKEYITEVSAIKASDKLPRLFHPPPSFRGASLALMSCLPPSPRCPPAEYESRPAVPPTAYHTLRKGVVPALKLKADRLQCRLGAESEPGKRWECVVVVTH